MMIFGFSFGLFCYMVAKKLQMLLSKDKRVDIDVSYPDELWFPAVTVCNQNNYR